MARPSIIDKLRSELHRPIETEMQVVYILVEIRKLLEHNRQKNLYPVMNFYCNWVVHTRLSESFVADKIVRLFDEIMYRDLNGAAYLELKDEALGFLNERQLQDELRTFLGSSDLRTEVCTDPVRWHAFRKRLAGVIEDVPLELRPLKTPNPTHFVESVILKNKSTAKRLNVEWELVMHSVPVVEFKDSKSRLVAKRPIEP